MLVDLSLNIREVRGAPNSGLLPSSPAITGSGVWDSKDAYQLETAVICAFFSRMGHGDACLSLSPSSPTLSPKHIFG